jgi:urease accessory protein
VLIGAGLLAARFSAGPWLVPAFVIAMVAGALVHMAGIGIPAGEVFVAASVVAVGAAAALRPTLPFGLAAALFTGAGLVHGHALAEAIIGAEPAPLLAYLAGLITVQTALAGGALLFARWLAAGALQPTPRLRLAGVAVATFGLGALALSIGS